MLKTVMIMMLLQINSTHAENDLTNSFIKSFVLNENKPTTLVFCDLCWSLYEQHSLAVDVVSAGVRVSRSMSHRVQYREHHVMFLLDLDCHSAQGVIDLAMSNALFRSPYRWLMLTSSPGQRSLLDQIQALPDSDVVLAEETDGQYNFFELHRPSSNFSLSVTPRGHFNSTLTDVRPRRELYRRRMDLLGHPLVMAIVIQDSNNSKLHLEDGLEFQHDSTAKLSWMNARIGMEMLNATPRYIFSYRYGYKLNGTWSGMIDDVKSARADMGTNLFITDTRREVTVGTETLAPYRLVFLFRQPPLSYVSNIYSLPFSSSLWLGTAVSIAVSAAALWIATRWEARFSKEPTKMDGSMSDVMFLTVSAITQQGCAMEPNKLSGRILVWAIFLALMALYSAYSANIVALLQAPSKSITTLPQLAASKITLAAYEADYNHYVFQFYNDPMHVSIYKRVDPDNGKSHYYDLKEGVERIRQGLFAFHCINTAVYRRVEETFFEHEKCDLTEVDYVNSFDAYVPMKTDSPYLELVTVAFKRLRETGVVAALNARHQARRPRCAGTSSAFSSVGLRDVRAPLALLAAGLAAAALLLLAEILLHTLIKKYDRRNKKRVISTRVAHARVRMRVPTSSKQLGPGQRWLD